MFKLSLNRMNVFDSEISKIDKKNSYFKYWLEIERDYPIAVLYLIQNRSDAENFAGVVLRKALKFHHTDAVLAIAKEFPRFLLFSKSGYNVEYYIRLAKKHKAIHDAEFKARMYSAEMHIDFARKMKNERLLAKLKTYIKDLNQYARTIQSYEFQKYYYELNLRKNELLQDDKAILATCKSALEKFNSKRFKVTPQVIFAFEYPKIPILIANGEFAEAKRIISKWSRFLKKGQNNHFALLCNYIILLFRMNKISQAKQFLKKYTSFPTPLIQERFELYNAYADLFSNRKFITPLLKKGSYQFQKDKSGYNVAILFARLMHLLKLGDDNSKDQFIEKLEANAKYAQRYMKEDPRSYLFLKILLMIPSCCFERKRFVAKSKKEFDKFKRYPIKKYSKSIEIEMVAYEVLYVRVLGFLG